MIKAFSIQENVELRPNGANKMKEKVREKVTSVSKYKDNVP